MRSPILIWLGLVVVALFTTMCHSLDDADDALAEEDAFEDVDDFDELEFSDAEQADDVAMVEERFIGCSILKPIATSTLKWIGSKFFKKRADPGVGGPLCPAYDLKRPPPSTSGFDEEDSFWDDQEDATRRRRSADEDYAEGSKPLSGASPAVADKITESPSETVTDATATKEVDKESDNSTLTDRTGGFRGKDKRLRQKRCTHHSQCSALGQVCCPHKKMRGYFCRAMNLKMTKHKKGVLLAPRSLFINRRCHLKKMLCPPLSKGKLW